MGQIIQHSDSKQASELLSAVNGASAYAKTLTMKGCQCPHTLLDEPQKDLDVNTSACT